MSSIMKIDDKGNKLWYFNDQLHRDNDLPAIEKANGSKAWCLNGVLHRENDLPAVEKADGTKEWWLNGVEAPWLEESLKTKSHLDETLNINIDTHKSKIKI